MHSGKRTSRSAGSSSRKTDTNFSVTKTLNTWFYLSNLIESGWFYVICFPLKSCWWIDFIFIPIFVKDSVDRDLGWQITVQIMEKWETTIALKMKLTLLETWHICLSTYMLSS
jgi:hypothetical protein